MITAIIIDDEEHCIRTLTDLIKKQPGVPIRLLPGADNIVSGKQLIEEIKPDLVFLDVVLGKATSFDLLKQFPIIDFNIIFTTAYESYAVQAFKFSAIDYLLKPIDPDELRQAIVKLHVKTSQAELNRRCETLLANLYNPQKRLAIPDDKGFEFTNVSEIIYCEAVGNCTFIHLKEKKKITTTQTLKIYEEWLTEYGFFRIHRSYIVNLAFVMNYKKEGFVIMVTGEKLNVSIRNKQDFINKIIKQKR